MHALRRSVIALLFFIPSWAFAQDTYVITGYVSSADTTRYLQGARVEASNGRAVITDARGYYEIALPVGETTLTTTYTGLTPSSEVIEVGPNQPRLHNVQLGSEAYKLGQLVVTAEREGHAKAITQQKRAPNVKNVVASDNFGNIANGNAGELLQQLPGVSAVYLDGEVRSIMVRGIDPSLSTVSMDGAQMASPNSPGNGLSRGFEFEQTSLGAIETIEVTKAPTPDMPASSIGGNVNMVSKSAFDRVDKRYVNFTLGGTWRDRYDTYESKWWQDIGGGVAPLFNLTYGDRYGEEERIGVVFSLNANGRPGAGTSSFLGYQPTNDNALISLVQNPRLAGAHRTRAAMGGKLDYKLTEDLILSLRTNYNWYQETNNANVFRWHGSASPSRFAPGYTTEFQELLPNDANFVRHLYNPFDIVGRTIAFAPTMEYKTSEWEVKAGYSFSNGIKHWDYHPVDRRWNGETAALIQFEARNAGLGWTIDRRDDLSFPLVTQTAGKDLSDLSNYYTNVSAAFNDKGVSDTVDVVHADVKRKFLSAEYPFWVKAGISVQEQLRESWSHARRYFYVGPDGLRSTPDNNMARFLDTSGEWLYGSVNQPVSWVDPRAVAADVFENPELWEEDRAFRESQYLGNQRDVTETISAGYIMGDIDFGKLSVLGGLRYEKTETSGNGPLQVGGVFVGRRNIQGSYDNTFPSMHLRYEPTQNLVLRASFSTSIGRAPFNNIIPLDTVNDTAGTVTVSNPDLLPQYSDNFDVSAEYYFEPVGVISASVFRKNLTDFQFTDRSQVVGTGPDNGFNGDYAGYDIITTSNGGEATYEGFELAYQQQLTFLPGPLKGLGVYANYTKLDTEGDYGGASVVTEIAGFIPETANIALSYSYKRFKLRTNGVYRSDYLISNSTNPATVHYESQKWQVDVNMEYRLSDRFSIFMDAININHSAERRRFLGVESKPSQYYFTGTQFVAGFKGRF